MTKDYQDYQGDEKSKSILRLNDIINDLRFRIESTSDKNLKDWLITYETEKANVVLKAVKTADNIMTPARRDRTQPDQNPEESK